MTELKHGDRVRVTFEGVFESAGLGGAVRVGFVDNDGDERSGNVPGSSIEVIKPEPPAQPALAGIVEVGGKKYVRILDNQEADAYRGMGIWGDFYSWVDLQAKGEITVLFDPDNPTNQDKEPGPVAHPSLRDSEGDRFEWVHGDMGPGYYLEGNPASSYHYRSREALDRVYGPLTEI